VRRVDVACAILLLAAAPLGADLAELKARGTLRVIVAAEEARETFDPAGSASGFERELVEGFARLEGLRLEVVVARGYAERIPLLLGGKGDLVVAIFDTPERRQQVAFTAEVMPTYNVAVTLPPRPAPGRLEALRREKVGVLRGTAPVEDALAAGIASLQKYDTTDAMLQALQRGDVSALVMPVSELALALKTQPALQPGVQVGATGQVAWAVRREDAALRAALDRHLGNVRRSAAWNQLLVKYFGERAPFVLGHRR
jgi:ABC-type amino acid transport substrate-binding protein